MRNKELREQCFMHWAISVTVVIALGSLVLRYVNIALTLSGTDVPPAWLLRLPYWSLPAAVFTLACLIVTYAICYPRFCEGRRKLQVTSYRLQYRCTSCGYSRVGLPTEICPECGNNGS